MKKFYIILFSLTILLMFHGVGHAREFLNSLIQLNVSGSYSYLSANMLNSEEAAFHTSHLKYSYGFFADIAPFQPFILGDESNAFKIGLRISYTFHVLQESMRLNFMPNKTYKGELLKYQTFMAGPVIRYAPQLHYDNFTDRYTSRWGFSLFFLYGQLVSGSYKSHSSWQNMVESAAGTVSSAAIYDTSLYTPAYNFYSEYMVGKGLYKTKITGHKIDVGFGAEVGIFFFNLGINFYYSRIMLQKKVPKYIYADMSSYLTYKRDGSNPYLDEFCIEGYLGIPIEWSFFTQTH